MNRLERVVQIETPKSAPQYELRVRRHGATDTEYEIWQVPSTATPQVKTAVRVAGLRGRNLEFVEHRVLRRLTRAGIRLSRAVDEKRRGYVVTEDLALTLGLIFRTLAPMRSRENMRAVIEGIEAMEREETAYWLGMAMHRPNPRRVLSGAAYPANGNRERADPEPDTAQRTAARLGIAREGAMEPWYKIRAYANQ